MGAFGCGEGGPRRKPVVVMPRAWARRRVDMVGWVGGRR